MLAFVDESGDPGLKLEQGSSRYFIVTIVIFEDRDEANAADERIALLKRELRLKVDFEFHFKENKASIREAFLKAVSPYDFFYFSIVINKEELYGDGFKFKGSFYKYACSLVFENAKQYLDQTTVLIDGSGSREFRNQLQKYIKRRINEKESGSKYIKRVKIQSSKGNNLLQLADMICGSVARSFNKKRKDCWKYRNLIKHREIYVQFWPKT